ncbi:threonine aldolase [Sesbania bispinosa]|nr:threonine aldolase [Sesbania bispinosa]
MASFFINLHLPHRAPGPLQSTSVVTTATIAPHAEVRRVTAARKKFQNPTTEP